MSYYYISVPEKDCVDGKKSWHFVSPDVSRSPDVADGGQEVEPVRLEEAALEGPELAGPLRAGAVHARSIRKGGHSVHLLPIRRECGQLREF